MSYTPVFTPWLVDAFDWFLYVPANLGSIIPAIETPTSLEGTLLPSAFFSCIGTAVPSFFITVSLSPSGESWTSLATFCNKAFKPEYCPLRTKSSIIVVLALSVDSPGVSLIGLT